MDKNKSFKELVAQVKRAHEISDYITQSGVTLNRSGGGKWKGLCPFHNEKTPSFTVDDRFQSFRCFGCGANGDIIGYIQKTENLDFIESLTKLGEDKGIEVTFDRSEQDVDYRTLRSCLKDTANFFYKEFKKLPSTHEAVKEITDRNLSVKGMLYGYAPAGNALYKHLSEKGYSDEIIVQAGVCSKSEKYGKVYDFWQSRLMFFVTDITGKPIGFSGRKLYDTDTRGKYINSPDTPMFDKSSSLYNIHTAKSKAHTDKTIFITEGQFDVGAFIEAGLTNTVASLGTAFTERHAMINRRLVTEQGKIVFCFDGDTAGVQAIIKVFKQIPTIHSQAYVVQFPEGKDPCDFLIEQGPEALNEYVTNNQKEMVEVILEVISKESDLESTLGRSQYINEVAKVLKTISSFSLREVFIKKVALNAFMSIDTVREAIKNADSFVTTMPDRAKDTNENDEIDDTQLRPDLDGEGDLDQKEIIELIEDNYLFSSAARMVSLSFIEPLLMPYLIKCQQVFPEDLQWIIEDIKQEEDDVKLVAESFTYSEVMNYILNANFFDFLQMMTTEDFIAQFDYLKKYLQKNIHQDKKESSRRKIYKTLSESKGGSVQMLAKAIAAEEKYFSKIEASINEV